MTCLLITQALPQLPAIDPLATLNREVTYRYGPVRTIVGRADPPRYVSFPLPFPRRAPSWKAGEGPRAPGKRPCVMSKQVMEHDRRLTHIARLPGKASS